MPREARLENFLKKYGKRALKFHCSSLQLYAGPPNCITGASKSGGQGASGKAQTVQRQGAKAGHKGCKDRAQRVQIQDTNDTKGTQAGHK